MMTTTLLRRPDEPAPDLTDYLVVHRAMTTDLRRLAEVADRIARGTESLDARRAAALRAYLVGIGAEIRSHHQIEDDHVWPFLVAVSRDADADTDAAGLTGLTSDHEELDPLLDEAERAAAGLVAAPTDPAPADRLADVLATLSTLLDRHIADEEHGVFPVIRRYVRVADYRRLQRRFRGNLSLRALVFAAPWVVSHATAPERAVLLADAGVGLRILLRVVGGRFAALQRLVFG
jgi:iron-sulfur cluster repair protein YtfE (RIC family)